MQNPVKCGFLGLKKCYNEVTDRYDSTDKATWDKFVSGGWVLEVRKLKDGSSP